MNEQNDSRERQKCKLSRILKKYIGDAISPYQLLLRSSQIRTRLLIRQTDRPLKVPIPTANQAKSLLIRTEHQIKTRKHLTAVRFLISRDKDLDVITVLFFSEYCHSECDSFTSLCVCL